MVRALTWTAVILVCGLLYSAAEARSVNRRPRKTTTSTTTTTTTTLPPPDDQTTTEEKSEEIDSSHVEDEGNDADEDRYYHPAEVTKPRVLEQIDRRFLDGNFEYKYVLSNGVSRHEKSYWVPAGRSKALARKGYYSHPLPNGKFLTVFYTADDKGFHQDSSNYSAGAPILPRHLDVPQYKFPETTTPTYTTTRKPKQKKPTRKPKQY